MFTKESFEVFEIPTLEDRMAAIRAEIQPIFQQIDEKAKEMIEEETGETFYIHIAQHRRRTVYPPENTWSALSQEKKGYKMMPHFQLGIWADYVFVWLSCIDQPKQEKEIAQALLSHGELLDELTTDFVLSGDHTKDSVEPLTKESQMRLLKRFKEVKKGEFQVGRILPKDSEILQQPKQAEAFILETFKQLIPLYQQMRTAQQAPIREKAQSV